MPYIAYTVYNKGDKADIFCLVILCIGIKNIIATIISVSMYMDDLKYNKDKERSNKTNLCCIVYLRRCLCAV